MPMPALPSRCRPYACPLAHLAYAAADVRVAASVVSSR